MKGVYRSSTIVAIAASTLLLGATPSFAFKFKIKIPNPIKIAKSIGGDITHPLRPIQRTERNIRQTASDLSKGKFRPGTMVSAMPGAAPYAAAARASTSSGPARGPSPGPRR